MNDRKPAYLAMCAAECLRACLAFSSLLPLMARGALRPGLVAAIIASPQMLLPLMWFYLWRDPRGNAGTGKLILIAKGLSALAGLAWASAFIIGIAQSAAPVDRKEIGAAAVWGMLVIFDFILGGASFFLTRGTRIEEG